MSSIASMTLAITAEQHDIRDAITAWAGRAEPIRTVRAERPMGWKDRWQEIAGFGVFDVAVRESSGGAGGCVVDLAVMLEALSVALVPGPVLDTAVAAVVLDRAGRNVPAGLLDGTVPCAVAHLSARPLTLSPDGTVTGELAMVDGFGPGVALLAPAGEGWVLVDRDASGLTSQPIDSVDHGTEAVSISLVQAPVVEWDLPSALVERLMAALVAAQAAGIAAWALTEAVRYACVREQFGAPIGSFQAIKHLCAWMLCRAEQSRVLAWDAATALDDPTDAEQQEFAAAAAAGVAVDAAVLNTQDCIQVHGGIGFTWEHDAHLYLRRAVVARAALGGTRRWQRRVVRLAGSGVRRRLTLDLGEVEQQRPAIAADVGRIAALPPTERRVALANAGLIAPHWPPPYGLAADPALQVLIDQECVRAGVERPDLVIGWWAIPPILQAGTPEQIERFVPATLRGDIAWCQLFSEPGAGSDLASLTTRAEQVDGGFLLTGQKVWNSLAGHADYGICLARTDRDAPKRRGITFFVVDMTSPGVDVRPLREITGQSLFNEVFLDGVFVPDERIVGEVNQGWALARVTLANERVQMSGGTRFGHEVEELLRRVGRGLVADEALDDAGALVAQAQSVALLQHRAVVSRIGGAEPGAESSIQKLVGVRNRKAGAEFLTEQFPTEAAQEGAVSRMLLNTRQLSIAGGSEQILLTLAGEGILGLPR